MEVIFVADQIPEERQWALILVAGGDEAYNRWDTLEDTVTDRKLSQEADDTENGHFRSEQHSKSKDAQFRGHQITNKEEGHWSETWQRCGRQ